MNTIEQDTRPQLGQIKFTVSREAQKQALLKGEILKSNWTVGVRTKESARMALDLGAEIKTDGTLELDAMRWSLDTLPDLNDALPALMAIQAKKLDKENAKR